MSRVFAALLLCSSAAAEEPAKLNSVAFELAANVWHAEHSDLDLSTLFLGATYARHLNGAPLEFTLGTGFLVANAGLALYGKLGVRLEARFSRTQRGYLVAEGGGFGGTAVGDESNPFPMGGFFVPVGLGYEGGPGVYGEVRYMYMELNHVATNSLVLHFGVRFGF